MFCYGLTGQRGRMQIRYKKTQKQSSGFATKNDLERISFSIIERRNQKIDNKSNILLSCFIALSKLGKIGITSPIFHILKMINNSGFSISERSLYRALNILQNEGIIRRNKYRIGDDRFCSVIVFNDEAFSYWTGKKSKKVIPVNTCNEISHNGTQLPKRQEVDRTKIDLSVNIRDNNNKYTKPRAGARDQYIQSRGGVKVTPPSRSGNRKNAIMRSIVICLDRMKNVHRSERKKAISRARSEIHGIYSDVKILNPSGIDWKYWISIWSEFSIPVRESTAIRDLIPCLLGRREVVTDTISKLKNTELNTVQKSEIEKIERYLCQKVTEKKEYVNTSEKYPDVDQNDPDMAILIAAREKMKSRVV